MLAPLSSGDREGGINKKKLSAVMFSSVKYLSEITDSTL